MTDIESMLLNDIPYLNALNTSETAARALYKKYALPDIRYVYMYVTIKVQTNHFGIQIFLSSPNILFNIRNSKMAVFSSMI